MMNSQKKLISDFVVAIDACAAKSPFGLMTTKAAQETPSCVWALGTLWTESAESYRKRCFHPCGSKKKHKNDMRKGLPVLFRLSKLDGKFEVKLQPGFDFLAPKLAEELDVIREILN